MSSVTKNAVNSNADSLSPHVGYNLAQVFKSKLLNTTEVAKKVGRTSPAIAVFKKQGSIQTSILWEFCHALKYNFFADIAKALPKEYAAQNNHYTQEIEDLKSENYQLKIENEVLKKVLMGRQG